MSAILKLANKHGVPVTPRGGGSGYTGGCIPVHGGVVMAMDRFNNILEIDTDNYLVILEPGVVTKDLQGRRRSHSASCTRRDPASTAFSTIGGNIAENAGGIRAVKYGVTKNYVMGLEVVLPTGRGRAHRLQVHQGRGRLQPDGAVRGIRGHARRHHQGRDQGRAQARGPAYHDGHLRPRWKRPPRR